MKFIDPRIDFAFKKIFGSEEAKDILISFLESLLQLEGDRRIAELTILDPFLAPKIRELKYSILDVQCRDQRGISYIVEMQVQKVAAFLKRIQYNAAKTYTHQIERGDEYPKLNQVIAITITDFILFDGFEHCVSRHESRETITGQACLKEIVHLFIELPKFAKPLEKLDGILDMWIYFIQSAGALEEIPAQMDSAPFQHAFERARVANMTKQEMEWYDKAGIAITDARGAVDLARQEGEQKGGTTLLTRQLQHRFGTLPAGTVEKIAQADLSSLEKWGLNLLDAQTLEGVFADKA